MPPINILTDASVLFPNPVFEGREHVTILPAYWQPAPAEGEDGPAKASDFPISLTKTGSPLYQAPTVEEFKLAFQQLGSGTGVLAVVHAGELSPTYANAERAAKDLQGKVQVRVVDSGSVSLGLGMMVQVAAQAAESMPLNDLDLHTRSLIGRIYSQLCIPSLSYLERLGLVNHSQALVSEYLGMLPMFTLEGGELVPTEKARNRRHLVDVLQEFLMEFDNLEHIALLQGAPSYESETRTLRERLAEDHPDTPVSEQIINAALASLIGPHSLGIFALERAT